MVAVDLLFDPFGGRWPDLRDAASTAEEAGFDGVWTYDHLAGMVHDADTVLEGWTVLSALAAVVPRVMLGPMVLNVANRRPGVLAVMAATLQEVSEGRLLLGLGAGGGRGLPYPREQRALGEVVPPDGVRRQQVREAARVLRAVWSGTVEPWEGHHYRLGVGSGFPVPRPAPPVVLGAFGPKMAALAGEVADGINTGAGAGLERLLATAHAARRSVGRESEPFVVTVGGAFHPNTVAADRLAALASRGVDRVVLTVPAPYDRDAIRAVGAARRVPHRG
ncbi:MAG: LLM class flavin-dependent oxidoreductase [Acidimicrobiales bacterium]|jgi:alkanesulfonate monooxygenase SsuD/methylene tetrahydromethanopterin reductase-like flavin-dependent oxidoreductase (luciferase family)|nr:LLM class flavin-dependent oxidoreductase [Acidimicrobiales bacterium]